MTFSDRRIMVICVFVFGSASAPADGTRYACEKDGVSRYVEVVRDAEYACRVKYIKPSGTSYPWNARNEADYCRPRAIELVEKLGGFGWECDSADEVRSILDARLEQYGRYMKILDNVGKACGFYPAEAQFGNLCGDRRDEAAVVYTCDATGGAWDQHLAVFLELEDEPLIAEIGSSRSRQVTAYYIEDERVQLETQSISPADNAGVEKTVVGQTSVRCLSSPDGGWELVEN